MFDLFSMPDFKMPEGFLFGSGYAGHQVEGNNIHSNYWADEIEKDYPEKSGMACNSYELWETDVKIAEKIGLKAFRTSVEWSRIEPDEGNFCKAAADHYVALFSALKERGIKVFATLVHFTCPAWFTKYGDYRNIDNLKYFERYLEYIVPKIAPYVDFWNVMNEFNLGSGEERINFKLNCVQYHALGYHIIKKYSKAPVSSAHALVQYFAKRPFDRFDRVIADYNDLCDHEFFFHAMRTGELLYPFRDGRYLPDIKGTVDYWSINTYVRQLVDARKASANGDRFIFKKMQMIDKPFYLEEINPECVVHNLSRLTDLPVYITENGCSCNDDRLRIAFISVYLAAVKEAIDLGVDVKGYLYWAMLDNYEWGSYLPRFGLYDVDFKTFERTPKPSADFYREIIENNGFSGEILRRYLSENPRNMK